MSINFVALSGRLTRDPELKTTQSGLSVCTATLAVDRGYGQDKQTDFLPIQLWRGSAETLEKYCRKGDKITVIGALHSRSFEDKDGNKRTTYEVTVNTLELPPKPQTVKAEEEPPEAIDIPGVPDDLPF